MPRFLMLPALLAIAAPAGAATPAPDALHAIVNIDIMPSDAAIGTQILIDHAHQMRRDPAIASVVLIRQAGAGNHYILDTTFASRAAYDRFISAEPTRRFRTALYPHLGSPWDERLGNDVTE